MFAPGSLKKAGSWPIFVADNQSRFLIRRLERTIDRFVCQVDAFENFV